MLYSHSKPQFALKSLQLNKTNSVNTFAANTLQKSESKECEESEQLRNPINPVFDTKSTNHE